MVLVLASGLDLTGAIMRADCLQSSVPGLVRLVAPLGSKFHVVMAFPSTEVRPMGVAEAEGEVTTAKKRDVIKKKH